MSEREFPNSFSREFNLDEVNTFMTVFRHVELGTDKAAPFKSFRDLFMHVSAETGLKPPTIINHLTGLLSAFVPLGTPGVASAQGERLKVLFKESEPGEGLEPTDAARLLLKQMRVLAGFLTDLGTEVVQQATHRSRTHAVVRLGVPPTLAVRLLAYSYSYPDLFKMAARKGSEPTPFTVDVVSGNTRERLLPELQLGRLGAVISYGLASDGKIYQDPDLPNLHFRSLNKPMKMVLIYHPDAPPKFYSTAERPAKKHTVKNPPSKKDSAPPLEKVDVNDINPRESTLVSVTSWRQSEAIQEMIDDAQKYGRVKEVRTYEEALAIVRMGSGYAVVPEVFWDRRIVVSRQLKDEARFSRELGVYYSARVGDGNDAVDRLEGGSELEPEPCVSAEACFCLVFMEEYLSRYDPVDPPAYFHPLARRDSKKDSDQAHRTYLEVVEAFQKKYGGMDRAAWEAESRRRFPPHEVDTDGRTKFPYVPSSVKRK